MENKMFALIHEILSTHPINKDTQLKIEELVFNGFKELYSEPKTIVEVFGGFNSKLLSNHQFLTFIHDTTNNIKASLKRLKDSIQHDASKNKSKKAKMYVQLLDSILLNVDTRDFISIIISSFLKIVTYNMVNECNDSGEYYYKTSLTSLSINLGTKTVDYYIRNLYKNSSKDVKLKEFKDKLIEGPLHTVLEETECLVYIGGKFIQIMKECGLVEDKITGIEAKKNVTIITLTDEVLKLLGGDIVHKALDIPLNLPMIVEPKDYKDLKNLSDGGYLLNNEEMIQLLFTNENILQAGKTSIIDNKVIESINGLMKVPFKINTELLDYILTNPGFISLDSDPPYSDLNKRTKRQEKDYQRGVSEKILNDFLISIANTYRNVPELYYPVMMDFRGRLYPRVTYLNYQGSALAKALLLFARPGVIERNNTAAIEYLKSYGAVSYGHGLDKKSYSVRLNWVEENWDNIIELNNEFILNADNKLGFLAFCLEMKKFNDFYYLKLTSKFSTYLPIQLDATCNGFQHLALLSEEVELFEQLNLSLPEGSGTVNEDPKDFYSFILNKLKIHLQYQLLITKDEEVKDRIKRLLSLNLTRSNIKPLVMTKPYNASIFSMINYLSNSLTYKGYGELIKVNGETHLKPAENTKSSEETDNKEIPSEYLEFLKYAQPKSKDKKVLDKSVKDGNEQVYSSSPLSKDLVTRSDLFYFVNQFNKILYTNYPQVKKLTEYLDKIAKIFSDLNLPIVWRLPHGLKISQKYVTHKSKKIKPYSFSEKEITLTITNKNKIDSIKQRNALMPNLVHSLDATTMILTYHSLKSINKKGYENFYSIHDCFGVTADNVGLLISIIRQIYIDIYSNNKYIESFDQDIINILTIFYGGENKVQYHKDSRKITLIEANSEILLPTLPTNTTLDINIIKDYYKKLEKSIFLIN